MIRLGSRQGSVSLDWPGELPEPAISGATATYSEVMTGVDLELTATAEGYRQILVVKSAEAAASSALEKVTLSVAGDGLQVVPGAGGGLRAIDENGRTVFNGPAGQMWDSSGDLAAARLTRVAAEEPQDPASEGDPTQPGAGDATAVLPVSVAEGTVSIAPDLDLLRGAETVYPVRIDPPVGLGISERSVISSDGDRWWQFNGEYGVGLCGSADGYYCGNGYKNRMLFEMAPTQLAGKYVLDATFKAHETWSFNCDPHWVDLERTDNMSEGTRWPGPKDLDQMGDKWVSNGRGDNCQPAQPDAWVEFNDYAPEPDENLTATVRSFADGKISRLTLMLRAKDETDPRAWKRFDDNAVLQVVYAHRPGVPTSVGVIPGNGNTAYCRPSATDPLMVTRVDPMVQARVQTKVEAHLGDEEGLLQAEYIVERGDDAAWHQVWSGYRPSSGWVPDETLQSLRTSNRADGGLYRLKARTQSHWGYDGAIGELFSPYSSWCYFRIDSTAPKAPTITANGPYTECATANDCEGHGGPGVPGSFTFKPAVTDLDVKAYRWRLLTTSAKDTKQVSGSVVKVDDVIPSLTGTQVLSVEASDLKPDSTGRTRWGTPSEFTFKVSPAAGPVGQWHLNDGAPGSGVMTAEDTAAEGGTRHSATLVGVDGTGWSGRGRRGDDDYSLRLNDSITDPAKQVGYAATGSPVVNTKDSFTVSAWVQLSDRSANRVVMTEPGTNSSAFTLYYSATYRQWIFNRVDKDTATAPVYIRSVADRTDPPLNVWTHLAGVFDAKNDADKTNDTIQLFVNGRPQGKPVRLSATASTYEPWTATEGLQMGRSKIAGKYGEYFFGLVDEVSAWQQPLSADQIAQEARAEVDGVPTNALVAQWDAAQATATEIPETSYYPVAPMKLAGGAAANEDHSAITFNGATGYASMKGPVIDESGSFTVSASVKLDKDALASKPIGYTGQVAGQSTGKESSWALLVTKMADDVYQWNFTRTAVGRDGQVTQTAEVPDYEFAELDTAVQVTGVFDAQEVWDDTSDPDAVVSRYGKLHLYVGPFDKSSGDRTGFTAAQQGDGDLAAGRGTKGGVTANYLAGALEGLRVWTGAMTADQISSQVLPPSEAS